MFNIERWQEIFDAISKNKLRTFLTGLSVGSGIFILVILLGVANGMNNGIQKEFQKDAATKIYIGGKETSKEYKGLGVNRKIELSAEDYQYITNRYNEDVEYKSCRYTKHDFLTTYKDKSGSYPIQGVMPNMQFLENADMASGRFISEKDMQNDSKVAVIGHYVAKDLFEDYRDAVGKPITIDNINYTVIGVFTDPGGERDESIIFVPNSNIINAYSSPKNVGSFFITLNPEGDYDSMNMKTENFIDQIKQYLKKSHTIHPEDDKALRTNSTLEHAKKFIDLIQMVNLFFWGIGILTLIAGIVSVSNIMLIIVKERTKEIGIRKALGAQPNSIVAMILHESIFVTAIAGFIGLFFGIGILMLAAPAIQTPFIANPSVNFGVAISTVILLIIAGAIAGFIPARHAAQIKPIIALRDE